MLRQLLQSTNDLLALFPCRCLSLERLHWDQLADVIQCQYCHVMNTARTRNHLTRIYCLRNHIDSTPNSTHHFKRGAIEVIKPRSSMPYCSTRQKRRSEQRRGQRIGKDMTEMERTEWSDLLQESSNEIKAPDIPDSDSTDVA